MSSDIQNSVKTRRVFYIPGYDPIHPRRYRELYRSEGRAQAEISGYELTLSPKQGGQNYGWQVDSTIQGQDVHADVEVLVWSDIVRDSMANSIAATYWQLIRTAWIYITTGALWRLTKLRKGPVIAALYPVGMLIIQFLLACLAFFVTAEIIGTISTMIEKAVHGPILIWPRWFYQTVICSMIGGGLAFWLTLRWFKSKDGKFFAYYLMHDYAYSARTYGDNAPELEARMAVFKSEISTALKSDVDEVLVVGHSSGAHLGVSILADLLRDEVVHGQRPNLSFLSLGQVVPMVSFLPKAYRLRADLQFLSMQDNITWVDVTAPGDGCAFALCDPVSVSGVATEQKRWPLVFSAAFTQTLSGERWKELRWKFFRLHFQYMCAFDRPRDYDYFQITAGPQTLQHRYADRTPSKSRIDRSVSKYTSVTP
jgi:hypothetical protein